MTDIQAKMNLESSTIWRSVRQGVKLFSLVFGMNKTYMVSSIFLHILQGLMPVLTLIIMQNLLNSIVSFGTQGISLIMLQFGIFIVIHVLKSVVTMSQTFVEGTLESVLSKSLNLMIGKKSSSLGLADYENSEINDQLKRASQEASYRPYQLYTQMAGILSSMVTMVSSATLILLWKWWVVIILFGISLVSVYSIFKLNKEQFEIYMNRTPLYRESWYMTYLLTNDRAVKEVKIFNMSSYLLKRYEDLLQRFFVEDRRILGKRVTITFMYSLLELAVLLGVVWVAIRETFEKKILVGSLYGYIQAIMLTQSQMQALIQGIVQFSQNNLYMEQLFLFLQLPTSDPVRQQKEQALPINRKKNEDFCIEQICIEGVSFTYSGKTVPSIRDIHLTVNRGQTIAIVGKNGSGKSTLMKVLMQLYSNYEGVFKINGLPVQDYDLHQVQDKIGVVFQDFMHYEMSARHNIGFGSLERLEKDEELIQAARYAAIDQIITELPRGLDTQLGKWFEDGFQLSGGQWQRIAIARAFLRQADIYILDEPSSFLDPVAERDLLKLFLELMKDSIGIFITHRISSARLADKIVVMDNGGIVEQGTHRELMLLDGLYAEMYNIQASSFNDEEALAETGGRV
ncbi:ABC transporter ATP-binding protein [Paenibacillus polymyxa]|uniref:ABC transporter ATP-binding protein n=2 Tax=Paenibacillus polymyxa TaxID=1406 RepID=UPI000F871A26|nr:ABC transporter ATP-binding protein [Paenibacillus polymyxa]QDA27175.1 ABC transporter ATP-binding protein [Paenibacillus polymyxa]RTZ35218.1 ABC transporter ATP-binding protein [Paenibacillus polymyxa]